MRKGFATLVLKDFIENQSKMFVQKDTSFLLCHTIFFAKYGGAMFMNDEKKIKKRASTDRKIG